MTINMTKSKLTPVILSGGSGTRLWPLSRTSYPKQLLPLLSARTLLQETISRAMALNNENLQLESPILVCNQQHRFIVREQALLAGYKPGAIYLEPVGRNTAPAIALAALHLLSDPNGDPDALMLILPADHAIQKLPNFSRAVMLAKQAALQDYLVSFGAQINSPNIAYGYIKPGIEIDQIAGVSSIEQFVEKPDQAIAEKFFSSGDYLWNSGMFLFKASTYLEELGQYRPDILDAVTRAWHVRKEDLDFIRPGSEEFIACTSESIDYAVMQSTDRAAVVHADILWSDVGSWDALWDITKQDQYGNATIGDVFATDTHNSYLRSESRLVAVVGLENVVVVETPDAVLVMNKKNSQDVKQVIKFLEESNRREHLQNLRELRPWGWYEGIDNGERFQVKRIMVNPGEKLSLQMHHHRAEHWIVVSGTAKVTLGEDVKLLSENQSTYIPLGHVHRLENPGKIPLHLIEVQSGAYLNEDDIVRFDDSYGR